MPSTEHSKHPDNHFAERLLGAAGGAILSGIIGFWILEYFSKGDISNELIAAIAGVAGGIIAIVQRKWIDKKQLGNKE